MSKYELEKEYREQQDKFIKDTLARVRVICSDASDWAAVCDVAKIAVQSVNKCLSDASPTDKAICNLFLKALKEMKYY